MSLWEFVACRAGYVKANSPSRSSNPEITDTEYDALCELGEQFSAEGKT